MPRRKRNARRRSGLWWVASGVAAAAVVAAVVLTSPSATRRPHLTTPKPAAQGPTGSKVTSAGSIILNPAFVGSVDMTSGETGWASVQSAGGGLEIAHTTDQGATWVNVTPEGAGGTLAFQPTGPEGALVASLNPGQTATVYITTDGGRTWSRGTPFPITYGDGNAYLAKTGRNVWIEVGAPGMANALPAQLFASTDYGMHMKLVTQSASSSPSTGTFPGFGSLMFLNSTDGFTSAVHGGTQGLGLYRTKDGGSTWSAVHLPGGAQEVGLPVFSGRSGLVWAVQASSASATPLLFRTVDGGATWSAEPIRMGNDAVSADDIVNGTTAIVVGMSGNVYATTDGGANWHVSSPTGSAQGLLGQNVITAVSFSSPQVGWALMGPKGNAMSSPALYLTTDGGQSWTEVAK